MGSRKEAATLGTSYESLRNYRETKVLASDKVVNFTRFLDAFILAPGASAPVGSAGIDSDATLVAALNAYSDAHNVSYVKQSYNKKCGFASYRCSQCDKTNRDGAAFFLTPQFTILFEKAQHTHKAFPPIRKVATQLRTYQQNERKRKYDILARSSEASQWLVAIMVMYLCGCDDRGSAIDAQDRAMGDGTDEPDFGRAVDVERSINERAVPNADMTADGSDVDEHGQAIDESSAETCMRVFYV